MCSTQNENLINGVLDSFIGKGQAFTAFEVSLEAKKQGADERHRDMREYIHQCRVLNDELEFGIYAKTLVPVGNGHKAFLYHVNTFDPSTYVPLDTNIFPPNVLSNVPIAATQQTNSDIGYKLDYRNRLLIPTSFLRGLGISPGQRVNVVKLNQGGLKLVSESVQINTDDIANQQVVEKNGDIRLSFGTLTAAGFQVAMFQIEISTYENENAVEIYNIDSQGLRL